MKWKNADVFRKVEKKLHDAANCGMMLELIG